MKLTVCICLQLGEQLKILMNNYVRGQPLIE